MKIIIIDQEVWERLLRAIAELGAKTERLLGDLNHYEEWLDNEEVCRLLNISKRTLQTYRDNSLLPFSMVGHKVYYKKVDIKAFIKSSEVKE